MNRNKTCTAVQFGVGPIGSRIVTAANNRGVDFTGAIDIDPEKVGSDLGNVVGLEEELGVTITEDTDEALAEEPDIVFHSTVSSLETASPQLESIMNAGANVISTSEELIYPWWDNNEVGKRLDKIANDNNVTCIGTGINPGFVMDTMAAVLSTPMQSVESVTIERVQDTAQRRKSLQQKVGAGVDTETFSKEIASKAGHVGSTESVAMLASALGWKLTDIEETIEPVLAHQNVESEYTTVDSGDVAGIKQVALGQIEDKSVITLDLQMYNGASNPHDHINYDGRPDINITVDGGYHGDISTSAVITNVVPSLISADPGLATMIDLPLTSFTRTL